MKPQKILDHLHLELLHPQRGPFIPERHLANRDAAIFHALRDEARRQLSDSERGPSTPSASPDGSSDNEGADDQNDAQASSHRGQPRENIVESIVELLNTMSSDRRRVRLTAVVVPLLK